MIKKPGIKAYKYYRNGKISKIKEISVWYINDDEEGIEGLCILVGKEHGERHQVSISRKVIEKLLKKKTNE